jgi:hypothetical protein
MRVVIVDPTEAVLRARVLSTDGSVVALELTLREILDGHLFAWPQVELPNGDVLLVDHDGPSKNADALFWVAGQKFAGVGVVVGKPDGDGITPARSSVEELAAVFRFDGNADT